MNCETCGSNTGLTKSHFVKKNSVAKDKRANYDYSSSDNYFIQCLNCHINYERYPIRQKLYNTSRNHFGTMTRQEFLRRKGLNQYAERIEFLIK